MDESIKGIVNDLRSREKRAGMLSWLVPIIAIIVGVVCFLLYGDAPGYKLWLLLAFICFALFYFFFFNYVKGYYGKRIKEFSQNL